MKRPRAGIGAMVLSALGPAAFGASAWAGPPCAEPLAHCQPSDQQGHGVDGKVGELSDLNDAFGQPFDTQDDFVSFTDGAITGVCWWGLYVDFAIPADCSPGGIPDTFTVTYYNNEPGFPGKPGSVKAGPFDVTATVTKAASGNLVSTSTAGDLVEYEYTATHPAVAVTADECVWIEILNDTTGSDPTCIWLWSTAPSTLEGGIGDAVSWHNGVEQDFDLAFCVNVTLGPPSGCTLPIFEGCDEGATNICNLEASPDPGCNDPECCSLICTPVSEGGAGLTVCCAVAWSQQCVDAAVTHCEAPANCGVPDTGDCFLPNETPFCDDSVCCSTVCAFDPFCCDTEWDLNCVISALSICDCTPQDAPPNDNCAAAIAIGLGDTPIDNGCATFSPPDHATCNDGFFAGLGLDIWFSYTAGFTGPLQVSTCNPGTNYDTQLAVYENCVCGALSDPPLACNNNGALCLGGRSELVVEVTQGTCYLIRVGSSNVFPVGSGTLTLSENPPPPCDLDSSIPPEAVSEPEACGADANGGCDNPPGNEAFTPVQTGDIVHGTAWADGGARDTDWYELVLTETTEVALVIESEFPAVFGFADTEPDGSNSCDDFQSLIAPGDLALPCEETFINATLPAGTWWPYVAPNTFEGFPCQGGGTDYVLTVTGPQCAWDCDGSDDNNANVLDLLALIGQYDPGAPAVCDGGESCDFDDDGCVDVQDLLKLLGHYATDPSGIGCP